MGEARVTEDRVNRLEQEIERLRGEVEVPRLELPVTEVESVVTDGDEVRLRVRLKGQRTENRFLLDFRSNADLIETLHEAKKRNGTVWVRFRVERVQQPEGAEPPARARGQRSRPTALFSLTGPELVVRDLLE